MWALYFMNIVRVKKEFPHCITTILKQKLQYLQKRADWPESVARYKPQSCNHNTKQSSFSNFHFLQRSRELEAAGRVAIDSGLLRLTIGLLVNHHHVTGTNKCCNCVFLVLILQMTFAKQMYICKLYAIKYFELNWTPPFFRARTICPPHLSPDNQEPTVQQNS